MGHPATQERSMVGAVWKENKKENRGIAIFSSWKMFVQQNLINFIEAEKGKRWGGFAVLENHKGAAKSGSYEPQSSLHRPRPRPTTASAVDYADKPACLTVIWIQTLSDTDYALCMLPHLFRILQESHAKLWYWSHVAFLYSLLKLIL